MSKRMTRILALMTIFCMVFAIDGFAKETQPGKGYQKGQSSGGFFSNIGNAIKTAAQNTAQAAKVAAQKTGQAVVTAVKGAGNVAKTVAQETGKAISNAASKVKKGAKIAGAKVNNAIKDSYVHVKWKLTGRKPRVWVIGHFDKNGVWRRGHWRRLTPKEAEAMKPGNNHPGQGGEFNTPDQSGDASQAGQVNHPGQSGDASQAGQVNHPGQSGDAGQAGQVNYPDQSNDPVQDGDPFTGQPEYEPEDPVLPDFGGDDISVGSAAPATGGYDEYAYEEEEEEGDFYSGFVAPELEQEEIDLRTLGMLLNDLVDDSQAVVSFREASRDGMMLSVDETEDLELVYDSREQNANLLSRVIVWDLQQNEGEPGQYYRYFTFRMNNMDAHSRRLIQDVINRVRDGVRHGAGHVTNEDEQATYELRLNEMSNY